MSSICNPQRRTRCAATHLAPCAAAVVLALCACGGGGTDGTGTLSNEDVQGYAADAATMPVTAGTAVGAATAALQSALATAAATATTANTELAAKPGGAAARAPAEAGSVTNDTATPWATTATTTVPCALGGSVSWVASGLPLQQLLNRQLDAGETYDISYNNCATAITGVVLTGTLKVVVNTADASGFDLSTTVTALTSTTAQGRFVLDGSWRHQLHVSTTASGGTERVNRLVAPLATLASSVGSRQARYELRNMDWTTTDLWDASGRSLSRSHTGSLELFASTPRRPSATLQVATVGTLVLGSDGLAASGGFSVVAGGNKWSVTYGASTVTLALDLGNDGSVDRSWTLPRLTFHGEAG